MARNKLAATAAFAVVMLTAISGWALPFVKTKKGKGPVKEVETGLPDWVCEWVPGTDVVCEDNEIIEALPRDFNAFVQHMNDFPVRWLMGNSALSWMLIVWGTIIIILLAKWLSKKFEVMGKVVTWVGAIGGIILLWLLVRLGLIWAEFYDFAGPGLYLPIAGEPPIWGARKGLLIFTSLVFPLALAALHWRWWAEWNRARLQGQGIKFLWTGTHSSEGGGDDFFLEAEGVGAEETHASATPATEGGQAPAAVTPSATPVAQNAGIKSRIPQRGGLSPRRRDIKARLN